MHKKLKFLFEDKLVIICGEEDYIISELSSFRYVETGEGIADVPIQGLDFEEVSSEDIKVLIQCLYFEEVQHSRSHLPRVPRRLYRMVLFEVGDRL